MDEWQELLRNAQAYFLVAGAGIAIAIAASLFAPQIRQRLLPLPRLQPARWGGREVLIAFLSIHFMQIAVVLLLSVLAALYVLVTAKADDHGAAPEVEPARLVIYGSPISVALTLVIVVGALVAVSRTRPHKYGLTRARLTANVILGVLTYVVMAPLTLGAYFVATLIFGQEQHPFEALVKHGFAPWEWALFVFATVVGAPLVEETVFRGVLQGWLRRASVIGHALVIATALAIGAIPPALHLLSAVLGFPQPDDPVKTYAPIVFSCILAGGYGIWMSCIAAASRSASASIKSTTHLALEPLAPRQSDWANARLAIYGSAMLFALVHGWPQSIPLFLLGLGLGWLAYRTQSLIGCMVCHALFNAVACLVLYWGTRDIPG